MYCRILQRLIDGTQLISVSFSQELKSNDCNSLHDMIGKLHRPKYFLVMHKLTVISKKWFEDSFVGHFNAHHILRYASVNVEKESKRNKSNINLIV